MTDRAARRRVRSQEEYRAAVTMPTTEERARIRAILAERKTCEGDAHVRP